jgi:hypothetical protein
MKISFLLLWCITQVFIVQASDEEQFKELKSQFDVLQSERKIFSPEVISLAIRIKDAMESSGNSKKTSLQLNMLKSELPLGVQGMLWKENLFSVKDTKWRFEIINDIEIRMKADGVGRNMKTSGEGGTQPESICVLRMIPQG